MARPPVAKLMDYGKFKYENAQKARGADAIDQHSNQRNEAAARSTATTTRPRVTSYASESGRQSQDHDHVRGREQSRPELGYNLLKRLASDVDEFGFVESAPKQDGRNMLMVLGHSKKKTEARAEIKAGVIVARLLAR
jgi:translation initiation factor IF-3